MTTIEAPTYLPETSASGGRPPRRLLLGMMLVMFVSGGGIGAGSTLMLINRRIEENENRHDPKMVGLRVAQELTEKLSLNEEQAAEVERIMNDHMAAIDRLRRDVIFPKMRDQFEQMKEQVDAVLDDQQRAQYHAWLDERKKRVCPPNGAHGHNGHNRNSNDGESNTTAASNPSPESSKPAK
jgi:hypothetical protein